MDDLAGDLADAVERALPHWVRRSVLRRLPAAGPDVVAAAGEAGRRAREEVGEEMRRLLALDVDQQHVNPLSLLRAAVRYPTEVLREAGVAPVERDDFSRRRFPDDHYDLTPATWSDVDPDLVDAGIAWGAAKAFTHKARHSS